MRTKAEILAGLFDMQREPALQADLQTLIELVLLDDPSVVEKAARIHRQGDRDQLYESLEISLRLNLSVPPNIILLVARALGAIPPYLDGPDLPQGER